MDEKTVSHTNQELLLNQLGFDVTELSEELMKEMKVEKLGEVDYLGYRCEKIRVINEELGLNVTTIQYGNLTM